MTAPRTGEGASGLILEGKFLPVVTGGDGLQRIPMKPLAQVIGVDANSQHRKLSGDKAYFSKVFGLAVADVFWAGQVRKMTLLRLDRVSPFILTLNPRMIRAAGNADAAEFVEQKHEEWLSALRAFYSAA